MEEAACLSILALAYRGNPHGLIRVPDMRAARTIDAPATGFSMRRGQTTGSGSQAEKRWCFMGALSSGTGLAYTDSTRRILSRSLGLESQRSLSW